VRDRERERGGQHQIPPKILAPAICIFSPNGKEQWSTVACCSCAVEVDEREVECGSGQKDGEVVII
jgi:hypothetical protein